MLQVWNQEHIIWHGTSRESRVVHQLWTASACWPPPYQGARDNSTTSESSLRSRCLSCLKLGHHHPQNVLGETKCWTQSFSGSFLQAPSIRQDSNSHINAHCHSKRFWSLVTFVGWFLPIKSTHQCSTCWRTRLCRYTFPSPRRAWWGSYQCWVLSVVKEVLFFPTQSLLCVIAFYFRTWVCLH